MMTKTQEAAIEEAAKEMDRLLDKALRQVKLRKEDQSFVTDFDHYKATSEITFSDVRTLQRYLNAEIETYATSDDREGHVQALAEVSAIAFHMVRWSLHERGRLDEEDFQELMDASERARTN